MRPARKNSDGDGRTRLFVLTHSKLGFVAAIAIAFTAVACSLETRGIGPAALQGEEDASTPAADAATLIDARVVDPADAPRESAIPPTPDAGAGGDAPDPCDQDGDGHLAAAGSCGGDDCCDTDGRTHPGQKGFFDSPDACNSFDYDCNGAPAAEFGLANCQLGFFTCSGDGFETSTVCGGSSPFASCSWAGVSCSRSDATKTQRCN